MREYPTIKLKEGLYHKGVQPIATIIGRGRNAYLWIGGDTCYATLHGVRLMQLSKLIKTITKPQRRKK